MGFPDPQPRLEGVLVRLEPLSVSHVTALESAAMEDRSQYQWTFVPETGGVADLVAAHDQRRAAGIMWPFAQVRRRDGAAVGITCMWDPRPWPDGTGISAVEIGWTWLAGSAQRTGINVESKLLLMTLAFGRLGAARVDLKTDARNERSRRAIAGLGAQFEGVLRNWSPSHAAGEEGRLRDSAMFSVTAQEWPGVEAGLVARLGRHGVTVRTA